MVDHFSQLGIRNAGFNLDGVPVLLIHVITGPDLLVAITQIECQIRFAF
jgi:hypothetical protein